MSEAVEAARAQAEEEMKGQAEHYTRVLAKQSAEHDKRMSEALSGAGVTTSGGARLTRAQADRALAENEYLRSRAEDLQRMVDALQAAMASGTNVEEARAVRARNEERRRKKDAKRRQKRGGGLGKEKEKGNKKKVQPSSSSSGIPRLVPRTAGARDVAL